MHPPRERGGEPPAGDGVSYLGPAVFWVIPAAPAVSCFVHTRLRMPVTAVVQGLFCLAGTVLAIGGTRMLLSFA